MLSIEDAQRLSAQPNLRFKDVVDMVNNPAHYTDGKIETHDFIIDKNLCYDLGQVVKYVSRAGKKDPEKEIEDLEKAQWYLNAKIKRLKDASTK